MPRARFADQHGGNLESGAERCLDEMGSFDADDFGIGAGRVARLFPSERGAELLKPAVVAASDEFGDARSSPACIGGKRHSI